MDTKSETPERKLIRDRNIRDYVIEFGRDLATAAEKFMAEQNRAFEAEEAPNSEYWSALQSAIYEFRKRADKTDVRDQGGIMDTKSETTEPRIFITVQRLIDGQPTQVGREISLLTYQTARFPGGILTAEINNMLTEIGYQRV